MKIDTQKILKAQGKLDIFTEERYLTVKAVMEHGMTKDAWMKSYLSLDPYNKSQWIADQMVFLVKNGHI
jgi:hypothetical protein